MYNEYSFLAIAERMEGINARALDIDFGCLGSKETKPAVVFKGESSLE